MNQLTIYNINGLNTTQFNEVKHKECLRDITVNYKNIICKTITDRGCWFTFSFDYGTSYDRFLEGNPEIFLTQIESFINLKQ